MEETHTSFDEQVQLHFDVAHPPAHLEVEAEEQPDQNLTLMAALSQAAAASAGDQIELFQAQWKKTRQLDYFADMYERRDDRKALQSLFQRHNIGLEGSKHVVNAEAEDVVWDMNAHYLDLQICVGNGLGLAAMLPNIAMHHAIEFRLDLKQQSRRFNAKYAKLGFDPTGCILWIGRSSSGEDSWLAWVPKENLWEDAVDVPPGKGKEDTTLSKSHYRMVTMFLSEMLHSIQYRDVIVTDRYPDVGSDSDFRFATNAL
jgi:hypothetical protein